jgi:hypothetical protein
MHKIVKKYQQSYLYFVYVEINKVVHNDICDIILSYLN